VALVADLPGVGASNQQSYQQFCGKLFAKNCFGSAAENLCPQKFFSSPFFSDTTPKNLIKKLFIGIKQLKDC
jgi:hypothetical protein